MVPLNTPLKNGQTCEIITAKGAPGTAGPSRDWLNPGYTVSTRTRSKVRAWFHAIDLEETLSHGRALVEKSLQREGKTAVNLEALAHKLGFAKVDDLFVSVGKEEFSLRHVEQALHDTGEVAEPEDAVVLNKSRASSVEQGAKSGVLVVGTDGLMTQLAKCCKPAPPDGIVGFVTRGKGVSIHRATCKNFAEMRAKAPERVIHTDWGRAGQDTVYPVDLFILAGDRQGLLRDISEVFSREKINVIGVNTQSAKGQARMTFTAEIGSTAQLQKALLAIMEVSGVQERGGKPSPSQDRRSSEGWTHGEAARSAFVAPWRSCLRGDVQATSGLYRPMRLNRLPHVKPSRWGGSCGAHGGQLVVHGSPGRDRAGDGVFAIDLQPRQPRRHLALHLHQHLAGAALVHAAGGAGQPGADPHRGGHRAQLRPVALCAGNGGAGAGARTDSR
jgi:predicted amino acid-binding ACT domain protein